MKVEQSVEHQADLCFRRKQDRAEYRLNQHKLRVVRLSAVFRECDSIKTISCTVFGMSFKLNQRHFFFFFLHKNKHLKTPSCNSLPWHRGDLCCPTIMKIPEQRLLHSRHGLFFMARQSCFGEYFALAESWRRARTLTKHS